MEWDPESAAVARLKELVEQGLTSGQIAFEMKVTRNSIVGACRRMGLRLKGAKNSEGEPTKVYRKRKVIKVVNPDAPPRPPKVVPIRTISEDVPMPTDDLPAFYSLLPGPGCKFPFGDPHQDGFHFCGQEREEGEPYCHYHCDLAYREPDRRANR